MQTRVEVSDYGSPSFGSRVVDLYFVSEWGVAVDGPYSGHDGGESE
jgi:hypothetical protein